MTIQQRQRPASNLERTLAYNNNTTIVGTGKTVAFEPSGPTAWLDTSFRWVLVLDAPAIAAGNFADFSAVYPGHTAVDGGEDLLELIHIGSPAFPTAGPSSKPFSITNYIEDIMVFAGSDYASTPAYGNTTLAFKFYLNRSNAINKTGGLIYSKTVQGGITFPNGTTDNYEIQTTKDTTAGRRFVMSGGTSSTTANRLTMSIENTGANSMIAGDIVVVVKGFRV